MAIRFEKADKLIEYNPETGEMKWKHRKFSDFRDDKDPMAAYDRWKNSMEGRSPIKTRVAGTMKSGATYTKASISIGLEQMPPAKIAILLSTGSYPTKVDYKNGDNTDLRFENLIARGVG